MIRNSLGGLRLINDNHTFSIFANNALIKNQCIAVIKRVKT
jgi:hypothetical protein